MSRLTEAQQTRLDELLAIHVPASVTRSPEEHERNKHFVRPFARQQRLTLVKENVRALKTDWRRVEAEIRWDDQCSNGYNTFAITGSGWEKGRRMDPQNPDWGGSCHDLLIAVFPQLRPLIQYHGMGSKGPTHYVTNTLYHASDRDCWGRKAGEPYNFEPFYLIGSSPLEVKIPKKVIEFVKAEIERGAPGFVVESVPYAPSADRDYKFGPKFQLAGMPACKWHDAPYDTASEAEGMAAAFTQWAADPDFIKVVSRATSFGEGKIPNFDHARSCAMWPDATDDQLQDADQLIERIPLLIGTFKQELEAFATDHNWEGFTY